MNIQLVEETIEKLDSVTSSKIILGEKEDFSEVHIVSNGTRAAKQIVRDVQSVLKATYNIQIDHKKISIAEIQDESLSKVQSRLKLVSISHDNKGTKAIIKVSLDNHKDVFENSTMGINTSRNIARMLVDVTLKTVEDAHGYEDTFILEDIKVVDFSTEKVVVVVITCIKDGYMKRLCGSSLIDTDYKEAVVKATLDALNRYTLK